MRKQNPATSSINFFNNAKRKKTNKQYSIYLNNNMQTRKLNGKNSEQPNNIFNIKKENQDKAIKIMDKNKPYNAPSLPSFGQNPIDRILKDQQDGKIQNDWDAFVKENINFNNFANQINPRPQSKLSNDNEILSGINLTFRDEVTNKIECFVEVPSFNNTSSVVSLVHEFIHFHMAHKEIDLNKKYYYTEIFSILAEKIAANKVEELLKCQDMVKKIENTRLNGIVWHYKDRFEEMTALQKIYNQAKKGFVPPSTSIEEMEKECPWLKGGSIKESYNIYRDNLAYSYGFGYICRKPI